MRRRKRSDPKAPLTGAVSVPGDKSISHRALLLGALADGTSTIVGLNAGDDVLASAQGLESLGVAVDREDNHQAKVHGRGLAGLVEPERPIDARNSGTTVRTMLGICAGVRGLTVFVGDETLSRRPMLRVVAPLRQMGATIDGRSHGELLPLAVRGGDLHGVDLELDVASAQVKTAILLAGCGASGATSVLEPSQSRDHTERMLSAAGVPVERAAGSVTVHGPVVPDPMDIHVPGDFSSAAFLMVAALLVPGSELTVERVGLNPTRTGLLDVLRGMGARIDVDETGSEAGEPSGSIVVRASDLAGIEVSGEAVATFIDEVPILALAATQAEGTTVIRGAGELRVKESDRIAATVDGINALGGSAEATVDGMVVTGPTPLTGGHIDSLGDHRIAMTFAIAGLISESNVRVANWSAVDTSFPEFLDVLGRAQSRIAP